jgi:hypothetical protein
LLISFTPLFDTARTALTIALRKYALRCGDHVLGWQSCNRLESDEGWSHHQCRPARRRSLSNCSHTQVDSGVRAVIATAWSSCPYRRMSAVRARTRTRDIPLAAVVAAEGTPWRVRSITLNFLPQGWEGSQNPIPVHTRWNPGALPAPHRRGANAHLLLVATKFSAVVALQGVATTYHDALTFTQSTALFISPPCPSARLLTTLIARWGRLG